MSYAVYVKLPGEKPTTNGVRFATAAEANRAGHELLSRWFLPTGFEVRESDDPVNYEFPESAQRPVRIESSNA